jgi:quercetin dioxygenase-like cupin family protein/ribosome-binding protein aMBF1 (putative translation factor)
MIASLIGAIDKFMEENTGNGTNDRYDDLLSEVAQFLQSSEEEASQGDLNQVKVGEEIPAEMGIRIKKARESRGLSIFDLYLRTNVDVDLLSQIEEGEVIPPLGTVIKLAKALDLKMGYFISGAEGKDYTIVRRYDRKTTSRYDSRKEKHYGYAYESLAPHKTDRHMEPFLVTLEPSETEEERSTHGGQEFIFVLRGKMEVRLGEEIHILEPGDSIYYDSTVPHLVKCHGMNTTHILAVLYAGK